MVGRIREGSRGRSWRFARGGWAFALVLAGLPANAEPGSSPAPAPSEPAPIRDRGALSFIVENDVFAGTDRNYTSGLRLAYTSAPRDPDSGLVRLARRLRVAGEDDLVRFGWSAGQSLFSPEDISREEPLGRQHPYAGWLYLGGSLLVESDRTVDVLALEFGIVGPAALGEPTQKFVHEVVVTTEPRGWDNQLANEPAAALTYDRIWRGLFEWSGPGFGIDVSPNVGLSLGNLRTQATVGATIRIGNALRNDFGPPRIRPSLTGTGPLRRRERIGGYLFAGIAGRAVAHNIFLDGNTTRESLNVERRPWVGDAQAGLVIQLGPAQLGFTGVVRSKEFESQRGLQLFGSVSLSAAL